MITTDRSSSSASSPTRQCVLLAGGLGTRMRPLTTTVPKILLPVAGEPFAAHQLRLLEQQGFAEVVLCIGYLGDQVRAFVGDGERFGLTVRFVDDGDELRGTAGALRLALDRGLLDRTFAVTFGDSYLPIDVDPVWAAFESVPEPALMTLYRNDVDPAQNNVVYRDGRLLRYQKGVADPEMHYIDFGLTILDRTVIGDRVPPATTVDLAAVMEAMSLDGELAGYVVHQRYFEVGSASGLRDLEAYLGSRGPTTRVSSP